MVPCEYRTEYHTRRNILVYTGSDYTYKQNIEAFGQTTAASSLLTRQIVHIFDGILPNPVSMSLRSACGLSDLIEVDPVRAAIILTLILTLVFAKRWYSA